MMVLREEPLCRRCHAPAEEVDHIVPRERGGTDERENLQALCKSCHSRKTVTEDNGLSRHETRVTLVAGPPGSGKSKYVRERMRWGDLVLEIDALYAALSGCALYDKPAALLPFACSARDAVLDRLARPSELGRAWIAATMPKALERAAIRAKLGASVVVLEVDGEECMRRIREDERRRDRAELWREHVTRWWREYERDPRDQIETGTRQSRDGQGGDGVVNP